MLVMALLTVGHWGTVTENKQPIPITALISSWVANAQSARTRVRVPSGARSPIAGMDRVRYQAALSPERMLPRHRPAPTTTGALAGVEAVRVRT